MRAVSLGLRPAFPRGLRSAPPRWRQLRRGENGRDGTGLGYTGKWPRNGPGRCDGSSNRRDGRVSRGHDRRAGCVARDHALCAPRSQCAPAPAPTAPHLCSFTTPSRSSLPSTPPCSLPGNPPKRVKSKEGATFRSFNDGFVLLMHKVRMADEKRQPHMDRRIILLLYSRYNNTSK
jgi:hypothetical protein